LFFLCGQWGDERILDVLIIGDGRYTYDNTENIFDKF